MKKNLLAIAVGAALATPMMMPAMAQADGPTVYGKVNISLENQNYDPAPSAPNNDDEWELNSNASRLGVKGDFDLDVAGLKAIYQAEFEISVDDGDKNGQTFAQRNIFGGLAGGFGTLKAGKFDTPTKLAQMDVDQFNDLSGDIKNIAAGENRVSNIIQYSTPKLADMVTLNLAFIPNEDSDDFDGDGENENGLADSTSISLVLEKDAFYAALSHDTDIEDELIVDETGTSPVIDITRVAAGLAMDQFELGALYQLAEESEGDGEETSYVLSGAFKIDRVKLKAQYGMVEGDQSDDEGTQYALGADYKLAKNSKVYAYYNNLKYELAGGDDETRTLGVGMEHKF
ncbi:porin [Alloalcanivorax marinus]|uniref:porin n=1 Tax=Alloalcanivorax marinus TaxID=1177169 RepID=UPI0021CEFF5D|nr:porin [Alloalcanivorax marinus]MCU5785325.1 porin [Alloalcanivorax marinus]